MKKSPVLAHAVVWLSLRSTFACSKLEDFYCYKQWYSNLPCKLSIVMSVLRTFRNMVKNAISATNPIADPIIGMSIKTCA